MKKQQTPEEFIQQCQNIANYISIEDLPTDIPIQLRSITSRKYTVETVANSSSFTSE